MNHNYRDTRHALAVVALIVLLCIITLALWHFYPRLAFGQIVITPRPRATATAALRPVAFVPQVGRAVTMTLASTTGLVTATPEGVK